MPLTETEHDIKEDDEEKSKSLDDETILAHPKRTRLDGSSAIEKMCGDWNGIRDSGEDDEGTGQIAKGRLATESDGSKSSAQKA
jgi:hypothetical protein